MNSTLLLLEDVYNVTPAGEVRSCCSIFGLVCNYADGFCKVMKVLVPYYPLVSCFSISNINGYMRFL